MKPGTIITLLLSGVFIGCANMTADLPPITDTPSDERQRGRVIWHELLTHTPEASQRFYENLFGWEFEDPGDGYGIGGRGGYSLIRHNGNLIGGMIDTNVLNGRDDISQWIMVLSVDDVDRASARFEAAGGQVLTPPTDLARRGRIAVVKDSEGALLSLLQTRSGDPRERDPDPGDFLWNELWSSDIDDAAGFYAELADFDVEIAAIGNAEVSNYRVLSVDGVPRAGIMSNPVDGVTPVWVSYLRVEDPAAIAARVAGLGGRVLIGVQDRNVGGQAGLIAGPSGAGIGLQTWQSDQQSEHDK